GSSPWRRTSIEAQADIAICSWAFVLSTHARLEAISRG
ncbi:MAG: hypothetical protein QOF10_4359, partial [Kribbellaceae bacterium]|nr:hypothetical protein [Kribbellaceae bacterium]